MPDEGRHRDHPVFLVAGGLHAWVDEVWEQKLSRYPGTWVFVRTPSELLEQYARWAGSGIHPRYAFFIHWSWRVPEDIVRTWECVNFHMTALPYGRGGSPLQNLILRGHRHTLITAHRMTEELDAGPIYYQLPLALDGRAEDIYRNAMWPIAEIVRTIMACQPTPRPQVGEVVTFQRRTPEQSDIRTKPDDVSLYDFIRMLDAPGYPPAYVEQGGVRYKFTHAEPGADWLRPGDTLLARVRITQFGDI